MPLARLKSQVPKVAGVASDFQIAQLVDFLKIGNLSVVTGAGISTESGIPDYRSPGRPPHKPMTHQDFINCEARRRRYWARSALGYRTISKAQPNVAHLTLAHLQHEGYVKSHITQNVDGLLTRGGCTSVTELHGCLHSVKCLCCGDKVTRPSLQDRLEESNTEWIVDVKKLRRSFASDKGKARPDGDMEIPEEKYEDFLVHSCLSHADNDEGVCGGILIPDLVFFGGVVPKEVREEATRRVEESDALLIVGSTTMVYSSFRLTRLASQMGKPVCILNYGDTRSDPLADLKIGAVCGDALRRAIEYL